MAKKYPRIEGHRRKPNPERDGSKNYGKPCVICGTGTCGEKWVQFTYMRGEDETVRVCSEHWKAPDDVLIQKMHEFYSANPD
jgi:hypothetical protein